LLGFPIRTRHALAAAVAMLSISYSAEATVSIGAGGRGVRVGQSSLIGTLDYSDTFTGTADGGKPDRPYQAAVQPPTSQAYNVENTYGNDSSNRFGSNGAQTSSFSFASDGPGTPGLVNGTPAYPGTSGAGSNNGFTQTGSGVDYGLLYGLRTNYIVQVDAVQSGDRIDISSTPFKGSLFQQHSLSVFFRGGTDAANAGNASIFSSIYNPNTGELENRDTPIRSQPGYETFNTGLAGSRGRWNNYAVRFDTENNKIEIYVNEQSKGIIDLLTFANGIYAGFSSDAAGAGGGTAAGENRIWTDNFQIGSVAPPPVPEPTSLGLAAAGIAGTTLLRRRGRRAI
jgi:hypothetical protein